MKKFSKILFTAIFTIALLISVSIFAGAASEGIKLEEYSKYAHEYARFSYSVTDDCDVFIQLLGDDGNYLDMGSRSSYKGTNCLYYWFDGEPELTFRLRAEISGKSYYSEIFKVKHTDSHVYEKYYSNSDATCTKNGTEYSWCVCPGCDSEDIREAKGTAGHNYQTIVKAATKSKDGKVTVKCDVCGKVKSSKVVSKIESIKLSKTSYAYTGSYYKPTAVIKDSAGNTLKSGTDYTISYSKNKYVGTAEAYITFKGNYSGSESVKFSIVPVKVTGLKVSAEKGGFSLKWTKNASQADGYEIQYSTKKDFSSSKNTFSVFGRTTVSKKVSNLTGEKIYYIRIRATKEVKDGVKKSSWSDAVKVKTLKGYAIKKGKKVDRYASAEKVLNAASLKPLLTNDDWLDAKVGSILKKITNDKMSTYEKVRAIHNYMVQHYKYGFESGAYNKEGYASGYDASVVDLASDLIENKVGVCDHWAALFMVMTRRIGLESYLQHGQINYNGDWNGHVWNTIRINGYDYVFDVEADFRNSNGGKTKFTNFCLAKTTKYKYAGLSANMKAFKEFKLGTI